MSTSDLELQKMVRGFRVSDLQSLLVYAGRNKGGKKTELQNRALDLIKLHSDSINMKIRELHINRYQQGRGHAEQMDMFPLGTINDPMGNSKQYSSTSNHQLPMGLGIGIPNYVPSMNRQMMSQIPDLSPLSRYPVNPDVSFKDLPFYDVLTELIKPTSLVPLRGDGLVQEKELIFYFRPQDLRELDSNTDVQVQLRIGAFESNREQDDEFPTSICLKVNNKVATLPNPIPTNKPGQEPKRPKRPLDITSIIRRSSSEAQVVCISWASNNNKPYVVGVFLVRKQTSGVLVKRLKDMGVRNPDHTTAMIKEKLCHDRDSEIATMSLRGSLICPLGKIKMQLPCRALTCTHLQCFDVALYVQMNEKKPKWICPVCDKPAEFKSLAIDGLFLDITRKAPTECTEVQFHENGSWTPVMPVKKASTEIHSTIQVATIPETPKADPKPKKKCVEVISLDSDSDTEESWAVDPPKKKPCRPVGVIPPISVENSTPPILPQESVMKFQDLLQPGPSKPIPSTSNGSSLLIDKNSSPEIFPGYMVTSTQSRTSTPPQNPPSTTGAYHDSVEILNNSSSSVGQCPYDFDLYSLITPNTNENFEFDETAPNDSITQDAPDIISID